MSSTGAFEVLAERGVSRGADAVFSDALDGPGYRLGDDGPVGGKRWKRRGAWVAAAAVLVAGIAATVVAGSGSTGPMTGVLDTASGPSDGAGSEQILAMTRTPQGFEVASTPSPLLVFQQLSSDGRAAERVLAIGTSHPGDHTMFMALDLLRSNEMTPSEIEQVAGHEVLFGHSSDEGDQGIFGRFDVARWAEDPTQSIVIATRGLTRSEVRGVIAALSVVDGQPVLDHTAVPSGLEQIPADPTGVVLEPLEDDVQLVFRDDGRATVQVGTERGSFPLAVDLLWLVAGSHWSSTQSDTLGAGRMVYRNLPSGAATATSSSDPERLAEILQTIEMVTPGKWVVLTGPNDGSTVDVWLSDTPSS